MTNGRYEVRLSGSGGQGMILAGMILGRAATIYDDLNATQSQAYGPEARGGASRSEVIISQQEIDYPKATNVDLLVALTQEACSKFSKDVKETGILIVDSSRVHNIPDNIVHVCRLPILDAAANNIGHVVVANILTLGIVTAISGIVTRTAIEAAVADSVPKGTEDLNLRALKLGFEMADEWVANESR